MKRPHITVKFAQTLDGKIAAKDGSSKWISGLKARKLAHRLRAIHDAVLVGVGTIVEDDPSLTTRFVKGRSPLRIILDPKLRIPIKSKVLRNQKKSKTFVITSRMSSKGKIKKIEKMGGEVLLAPFIKGGYIDLRKIIRILYKKKIKSILIEGGSRTISLFLKQRIVDSVIAVISPKILGSGLSSVSDIGIPNIGKALRLKICKIKKIGDDILYVANLY